MKNRNRSLKIILIIVIAVIWVHSCMPPGVSGGESGWVMELMRPLLAAVFGEENVTMYLVRKLGHFIEYFILGIVLILYYSDKTGKPAGKEE